MKRSPGSGRLSTDQWTAGYVAADTYQLSADLLGWIVRAEVAVSALPDGPWPDSAGQPLGPVFVPLPVPRQ